MRKIILFLLVVFGALPAQAAIDCNQEKRPNLNDGYICGNQELRRWNVELREREARLTFDDSRIRQKYSALAAPLQQALAEAPAEQKEKFRKQISALWAEADRETALMREEYEHVHNWLSRQDKRRNECKTEECIQKVYRETITKLDAYTRAGGCQPLRVPEECEVYAYNLQNSGEVYEEGCLSSYGKAYTYKIKLNRPGKCVYLFLTSPYSVVWDISATADTDLRYIVASGDTPQAVRGFPVQTVVENHHSSELLKNVGHCFNKYYKQEKYLDKLEAAGIAPERIVFVNDLKIGDNAEISSYVFNAQNSSGELLPTEQCPYNGRLTQLIKDGAIRRIKESDMKHFKEAGLLNLDNDVFIAEDGKYREFYSHVMFMRDNGYVLLQDVDELPEELAENRAYIFIPSDIELPANLPSKPVFKGGNLEVLFNRLYLIKASAEEVRKW